MERPRCCAIMDVPEAGKARDPGFEMTDRADGFVAEADRLALEVSERYPSGNSSAFGAVANFVNTIVGAGIVGLPFALAQVCAVYGRTTCICLCLASQLLHVLGGRLVALLLLLR